MIMSDYCVMPASETKNETVQVVMEDISEYLKEILHIENSVEAAIIGPRLNKIEIEPQEDNIVQKPPMMDMLLEQRDMAKLILKNLRTIQEMLW